MFPGLVFKIREPAGSRVFQADVLLYFLALARLLTTASTVWLPRRYYGLPKTDARGFHAEAAQGGCSLSTQFSSEKMIYTELATINWNME